MSNIQSYNALIDRFKAFASGHFILKTFSHGQIDTADLEKFTEYPFMHVVPSNVTYSKGTKTFSFQIVLADLPRDKTDKVEFQREVLSDLQRIAEDLVAEITNHRVLFGDLITVQNVTLEPFLEEFHNTLTGWTVSLELLVPYYWDACSIPAEWNDLFESSTGGTGSILTFIDSITRDENGNVSLVNDEATPSPNYYYGTNDEGVRGWYLTTDNVGLTCATIGTCQTIIDIEAAIDLLQQDVIDLNADVALKANTADISAVGFSNDYDDLDNKPTIPAAQVNSDWNSTSGVSKILNKPSIPSIAGLATVTYVDQQDALKVDKIAGKGLSTEDYTTAEKTKLAGIQAGAEVNVNADWNAVSGDAQILNKPTIPAAQIQSDWNQSNNVLLDFIKNKPTIPTSLPPNGAAGGDLTGTYPNPTVHRVHGVDLQSGAPAIDDTWIYVSTPFGTQPFQWQHSKLKTSQVQNDSTVTGTNADDALEHLDSTKVPTTRTISTTAPLSGGGDLSANRTLSMPKATTLVDGYLSATDWATFNGKQAALGFTPVPETRTLTINGTTQDLSANRTFTIATNVGTVTSVAALTLGTTGTDLSSTVATGTTTPVITLNVPTASAANRGALSATDWATFNNKQAALISGTNIKTVNSTTILGSGNIAVEPTITAGTTGQYYRGDKTFQTLDKTAVGLGNVDNTSDANKPISTATQTALNLKQDALGFTAENTANKQNSLAVDGTGAKFATVDAVNSLSFIDKGKRMVSFFTDFLTNATLDGAQSFASGGSLGLIVGSQIPNRTNQQGVAFFQTNIIATNYINYCSSSGVAQLWFGGGVWNYEILININSLSTALERYRMIFGFGSVISNSAETDGVFITYDEGGTANGTVASANWQCVSVANSVRTLTTSTTAVTASAWNKLRIEINAAGTSVTFYVNGTAIATHTTNIPLASNSRYVLMKTGLVKTIGLTTRGFYCDYLGYENILTTPR